MVFYPDDAPVPTELRTEEFLLRPLRATDVGINGGAADLASDAQGVLHFAYYDQLAYTIRYAGDLLESHPSVAPR